MAISHEEVVNSLVDRYSIKPVERSNYGGFYTSCELEVVADPIGEWVKYDDIRWMIQRIQDD